MLIGNAGYGAGATWGGSSGRRGRMLVARQDAVMRVAARGTETKVAAPRGEYGVAP